MTSKPSDRPQQQNYIDAIAERIYNTAHKDEPRDATPEGQPIEVIPVRDRPLYRIYAVLALSKGVNTCSADVHDAWAAWQANIDATHRSLIPFDRLDRSVQALDHAYVNAIHDVAKNWPQ